MDSLLSLSHSSICWPCSVTSSDRSNPALLSGGRPVIRSSGLKPSKGRRFPPSRASQSHDYHAVHGDVSLRDVPKKAEGAAKVLIPSLPEEADRSASSSPISSSFWEWKPNIAVHYERSGSHNTGAPAVLFLPGFGVGSFHFEKQLKDLGQDYRVWALDFVGQGKSLPSQDPAPALAHEQDDDGDTPLFWGFGEEPEPWARELVYSVDLWRDQVRHFVEQVIGEPVYLVGNSLGGYVALYLAASFPELVKGVTLLNATPFWGFLPNPIRSPRLFKLFPWSGTFPLPSGVRRLTELVWQKISDPKSIRDILKQVYSDHSVKIDKVFSQIIEVTEHPAAAAAFASIMFAPGGQLSFQESLGRCAVSGVPICLMYGREDPWVRPIWGLKVKQQLPEVPYYEITPAGHCPHDEVPEVVNYLLRGWIRNLDSQGSVALPLVEPEYEGRGFSKELEYIKEGSRKSIRVRFCGSEVSSFSTLLKVLGLVSK